MSGTYELVHGNARDREHRLRRHCDAMGLTLTLSPTKEQAQDLTGLAWMRDGGMQSDAAAKKVNLPWVATGRLRGRDVAMFMVKGAPGSVFAARLNTAGPVVRVYSRYGLTNWTVAISLLSWLIVGPVAVHFLWQRGMETTAIAAGSMTLWFGWSGVRNALALLGLWKIRPVCHEIQIGGDGEFGDRFAVACTDGAHAARVLSPEVRKLMMKSAGYGAAWWSIGSGWASCVSRVEPINRTHGGVVKEEALREVIELVQRVASNVDDTLRDRR